MTKKLGKDSGSLGKKNMREDVLIGEEVWTTIEWPMLKVLVVHGET